MSREKSIFEQMGGTYTEIDGILYPNILIGEEQTETMQDVFSGKHGDLWKKYMKENQSDRYYHLVRTGQLKQKATEINEEANEMLDRIMQQYLQKHKPENPLNNNSFMYATRSLSVTDINKDSVEEFQDYLRFIKKDWEREILCIYSCCLAISKIMIRFSIYYVLRNPKFTYVSIISIWFWILLTPLYNFLKNKITHKALSGV